MCVTEVVDNLIFFVTVDICSFFFHSFLSLLVCRYRTRCHLLDDYFVTLIASCDFDAVENATLNPVVLHGNYLTKEKSNRKLMAYNNFGNTNYMINLRIHKASQLVVS